MQSATAAPKSKKSSRSWHKPYVRTQGRKGQKKPRINLAFDSVELLDATRDCADKDNMSITQLVNIAVADYLDKKSRG